MSESVAIDRGLLVDNYLNLKPCSLPIPIGPGHRHAGSVSTNEIELSEDYTCIISNAGSVSTNEIELSEDYTCIISNGPNPKTTRIFGDWILECQTHELANFDEKGEQGVELPQVAKHSEGLTHYPSDEFLSFCYSCKKELDKGEDIYLHRGEKAFCNFDCRSEEIFSEEEIEKANESSKSSPESSYHEDLFLMSMPGT